MIRMEELIQTFGKGGKGRWRGGGVERGNIGGLYQHRILANCQKKKKKENQWHKEKRYSVNTRVGSGVKGGWARGREQQHFSIMEIWKTEIRLISKFTKIVFLGCPSRHDVVFLLDTSGSIGAGPGTYLLAQALTKKIIYGLNFANDRTRVGLMTFR